MEWLGEFFAAIPDVLTALWDFGDGLYGVAVSIGSVLLTLGFLFLAKTFRDSSGWISSICGGMAMVVVTFWLFGILPSAWIYFVDGQRSLLEDAVIPSQIAIGNVDLFTNFYQVFRDLIVVIETTIAMGALGVAALWLQKRYPRALAEGEEARPQSGGYK